MLGSKNDAQPETSQNISDSAPKTVTYSPPTTNSFIDEYDDTLPF